MFRDPRGGHNRKIVNENFFKRWSSQMAYIFGLIYADGTIIDARKSSRTCYLGITNTDKNILEQIRIIMCSEHLITTRAARHVKFFKKTYFCSEIFDLRIGNKIIFKDLVNLGLHPNKSLTMNFPQIPPGYLNYFLRGYFDGDGCLYVGVAKGRKTPRIRTTFTCGSRKFLEDLAHKLNHYLKTPLQKIYKYKRTYSLSYSKKDSLKILSFMYKDLEKAPYLKRKYNKFLEINKQEHPC